MGIRSDPDSDGVTQEGDIKSPYCFSTHLQGGTGLIEKGYELGAVVVHVGSDNAGHYYVCRKIGNTWYKCNDTLVQMIPSGLNQHGAYILLYTKT